LLVLLTLPVTVVTLGLFLFVINASVLDGFVVTGFWAAMLGSVLYSLLMLVVDSAMQAVFRR